MWDLHLLRDKDHPGHFQKGVPPTEGTSCVIFPVICCQFILNIIKLHEPKQNKVLETACHTAN